MRALQRQWSLGILACISTALVSALPARVASQTPSGYHVVKKITVGGEGGWDYALVDADARRLYITHASKVVVIDLDKDSVVGEIADTPGVHGVAIAAKHGRGFTSNGRDTTVTIFDHKTLSPIERVKVTGANPDAIAYDEASERVFTFNGRDNNSTVIDAASGKVVGTIALAGKPEFAQTDGKGKLYVNIETDPGQIQVIDTKAMKVLGTYPLTGCDGPSGLALDRAHMRLFSVCGNSVMAVSDPSRGKIVTLVPIGAGVDAASYDEKSGLIFTSNGGDGTMTVVQQSSADSYSVTDNVQTQRGSRTMTFDPSTRKIYMASVQYGPVPAAAAGTRPRAPVIPGSFAVLVLDRK